MAGFRWQGGYGAFTLARRDIPVIRRYVVEQKSHHADGTARGVWEQTTTAEEPRPGTLDKLDDPYSGAVGDQARRYDRRWQDDWQDQPAFGEPNAEQF